MVAQDLTMKRMFPSALLPPATYNAIMVNQQKIRLTVVLNQISEGK